MKRHTHLWPEIISFDNLVLAARRAQKGKRFCDNVLAFNYNLERELLKIHHDLTTQTYKPGAYRTFQVKEPKPRMISAAPYRDRVVHHALCSVIMPIFERTFIHASYANRSGFGTHRALRQFIRFTRTHRYILQCDIQKYFPSIDHEILKQIVRRKIKCPNTLWLVDTIIDGSNPQEPSVHYFPGDELLTPLERRRGLPIGNLTSQCFSNVYLNGFDHFVKEQLKATCYLRYVDDFAFFSDDREFLKDAREAIEGYLASVRLKIHPVKSQLFETQIGANFVGFRVTGDRIRVRNENLRRGRRRLKRLKRRYSKNRVSFKQLTQSVQSWGAHLTHADTWNLRHRIFTPLVFCRG
jgi:RNA-directed DNA polymerase